jgi:hypothetical protein
MPRPHIHIHWPGGKRNLLLEDEGETPAAAPAPARPQAKPAAAKPVAQPNPNTSVIRQPAPARKPGQGGEHFGAIVKTLQGQGFEEATAEIARRFGQACAQRFVRTSEALGLQEALAELEEHGKTSEDALRRHSTSRDDTGGFGTTFRGGLSELVEGATKDGGRGRPRLMRKG